MTVPSVWLIIGRVFVLIYKLTRNDIMESNSNYQPYCVPQHIIEHNLTDWLTDWLKCLPGWRCNSTNLVRNTNEWSWREERSRGPASPATSFCSTHWPHILAMAIIFFTGQRLERLSFNVRVLSECGEITVHDVSRSVSSQPLRVPPSRGWSTVWVTVQDCTGRC